MKIIIVRHGDPNYDLDCLTDKGIKEALALANLLKGQHFDNIYVSPLGRARQTFEVALGKENKYEVLDWLHEFKGIITYKDYKKNDYCWDLYPEDWANNENYYDINKMFEIPEYKNSNFKEEYLKVVNNLDKLLENYGYTRDKKLYRVSTNKHDTIILFCHFAVGSVILSHLLNISPMVLWQNTLMLTSSVTTIVSEERTKGIASFRMIGFSDISHLNNENIEPSFCARFVENYDDDQRH